MQEFDSERDNPREKIVLLDTNKLFMRRTDPYGFIELSLERGALPDNLKHSRYTTWEAAKVAVDGYLVERGKVELEVQPPKPVIPTLERKKAS